MRECGWCGEQIEWHSWPVAAWATLTGPPAKRLRCGAIDGFAHMPSIYLPVMTLGWSRLLSALDRTANI